MQNHYTCINSKILFHYNRNFNPTLFFQIDNNKYQSDLSIEETSSLGNLKNKLKSFNIKTFTCDGNNFNDI